MRRALGTALVLLLGVPGVAQASAVTAPTHVVKAGHVKLGYRTIGHGRPLVMVMGIFGTIDDWDPSFIDAVSKTRRVIVFDNRGVGRSTSTTGSDLTVHVMAQDTWRLIRSLHLRQPDVLGWSMGGFIAQDLAAHHPGSVRRLVLCATGPSFPHFTTASTSVLQTLFGSGTQLQLLPLLFPPDRQDLAVQYVRDIAQRPNVEVIGPAAAAAQTRAVLGWAASSASAVDPKRIRARTLVAGGKEDRIIPPVNQRTLAKLIPHSKLKLYPDAAHGFLFQERAPFARLLRRFLKT